MARRGNFKKNMKTLSFGKDVIFEERREQSRKPNEIYRMIEENFKDGAYLELFARPHNVRRGWDAIGNELPVGKMGYLRYLDSSMKN